MSLSAEEAGTYLYSFFKTLSRKNGFSLKCYNAFSQLYKENCATTHKLDGETSMFLRILLDPYVLKVAKGSFVRIVLDVTCKSAVVHHSHWPKIGNGFDDLSALFIQWAQVSLSLAFLRYKLY